ncbi:MAG: mucoidy inhibitor MuiA family protein [Bacteroidia bacterium]|nr:mucoidy inhibitor MuiA family protein [Bacteroidia bacterium]
MKELPLLKIESTVRQATVYTDRALVSRHLQTETTENHFILEIPNLPREINETTLQVRAWGDAALELQEIKLREVYHSTIPSTKVQVLKDELERLELEDSKIDDKLEVLEKQAQFLDSIKVFSSESISRDFERNQPNPDDWEKVLGFLGTGQNQLNEERYKLEAAQKQIEKQLAEIKHTLAGISGQLNQLRKSALLEFTSAQPGSFQVLLTYEVSQARWTPFYEARVDSENKKVGLRYYGLVHQSTGEDWTGVALQLSTARPHMGGNPPELRSWYLDVYVPRPQYYEDNMVGGAPGAPVRSAAKKMKGVAASMADMDEFAIDKIVQEKPAPEKSASVQAGSGTSVVFTVKGGSDVPGDGSASRHLIMENEFGARFRYLTVPKMAQLAYLTAEVLNETEYPMLPGPISIFMDGNFIGKASIKELVTPEEKFELNLGVDENIKVRHKLLKKLGDEKGLFSKTKRVNFAYLITLENQRKTAEEVIVRDQLPVSQNEKIKVELKQISPPENESKDKERLPQGALEWKIQIEPKGQARCEFAFTIEHPTEMEITGM